MKNAAVIGAGITGITLANLLQKKVNLTVFEKSREKETLMNMGE